jgi:glucose 1-dehydrogenase
MERPTVLITGVLGGIGSAIATVFSGEGWQVVGVDVAAPPPGIVPATDRRIQADIADPAAVTGILESVKETEGRLDALVNNAAIQIAKPFEQTTLEEWDWLMSVNLRAPFWCIHQALPLLEASGRGAVVNISSVHAVATSRRIAAYAASKGALGALTRALAVELADRGIRVNAVLPGAVDTPMLRAGFSRGHLRGENLEEQLREFYKRQNLGRIARPEEIAQAVLVLADHERSAFVTGESLVVDGGATIRLSTE